MTFPINSNKHAWTRNEVLALNKAAQAANEETARVIEETEQVIARVKPLAVVRRESRRMLNRAKFLVHANLFIFGFSLFMLYVNTVYGRNRWH